MKIYKKFIFIVILSMILNFAKGEAPVPLSYSNEVKFVRYSKIVGSVTITNSYKYGEVYFTNQIYSAAVMEYTNYPSAIIHCVAYGRGTNECFKLYTCEVLPVLKDGWSNADWCYYNSCTWISKP